MKKILSLIIVLVIFSNCSGKKSNVDLLKGKVSEVIIAFKENSPEKLKNTIASDADFNKILLETKTTEEGINQLKRFRNNTGNVSFLKKIKSEFKGTEKEWKNIKPYGFFKRTGNQFDSKKNEDNYVVQKIYFASKNQLYVIGISAIFLNEKIHLLHIKDFMSFAGSKKRLEENIKASGDKEFEFVKI